MLKGLVEDKEMLLADGRRLLDPERAAEEAAERAAAAEGGAAPGLVRDVVPIHPNFRLWVLANRPGFPFLGQDFFRECGDTFATHVRAACCPCAPHPHMHPRGAGHCSPL